MNLRTGCVFLAAIVLTAAITRYYFPSIQIKTVETVKEVVKTDVQTVVRIIKQPNGTEETVTTIVDHSTRTDTATKSSTTKLPPNWLVSGYGQSDIRLRQQEYGIQAQRRILGPVFIGALLSNKGSVGLSVGLEF